MALTGNFVINEYEQHEVQKTPLRYTCFSLEYVLSSSLVNLNWYPTEVFPNRTACKSKRNEKYQFMSHKIATCKDHHAMWLKRKGGGDM